LLRHSIPAVVFVCSGPVEGRRLFWFDAVAREKGEEEVERMKASPLDQWQSSSRADSHANEDDLAAPLSVEELKKLAAQPGIEIGSHTVSHPILANAPYETQRREIVDDKARLETWIGKPVSSFAYPNGRPGQDYTASTVGLVGESGFDVAFTTRPGFACADESPLECSRFLMLTGISREELAHRLSFSWRR
jgi:peptidoglycan/xylan/chitin deacetylase (PgdA/CDA1 family)